jgi:hypothetical protein
MSEELDAKVHKKISTFCAKGDKLAERRRYESALVQYNKAWMLIPEPKHKWNASTWVLGAIADASFLAKKFKAARDALDYVFHCPDAIGNPFLHLRYGQVLYLAGEDDKAADELMRAYMAEGREIFETEDAKYLEFLETRAKL